MGQIAFFLLVYFAAPPVRSPAAEEDTSLVRLAEGVYAQIVNPDSNAVSNSGVVILEKSVLVFDTHFTSDAALNLLSEIQKISTKPVRYLVNSHFHPDHSHGNQAFPNSPRILGSTNARRDMLQKDLPSMSRALAAAQGQIEKMKQDLLQATDPSRQAVLRAQIAERQKLVERMSRQKVLPPVMTIDDCVDLEDRGQPLQLLYLGRGHTDGDLVLLLPREKIAFVGDLLFNAALPNTQDAFVLDWIQTLKELLKLDVETFVPGHGAVGTRDDLKKFMRYLEELKEWVEPAVARGDSIEQVLRDVQLPPRYAAYDFQNFFPHNLQRIYLELKSLHPPPPPPPAAPEKKNDE